MNADQQSWFDHRKYRPFPISPLPQRRWPDQRLLKAPRWCSEDLRDGNQALIKPLTVAQKRDFFELLVSIGFKEIAVGFPSASQTDFDFARLLIEHKLIPDDVTVSVLTPAREALIRRSFEALRGAGRAIVHLYNSTSKVQREQVFKLDRDGVIALAVDAAELMRQCAEAQPETAWSFQYSPESFTATEPEFALEICNAVGAAWRPTIRHPVIFNLPATVENATPNVYADRIEWFGDRIDNRDAVILSVHTHNDRGCAVAAAELALLAGAQRVEGTLLGNGERTGNADLLVMAMNLYSQGIDPELDFAEMTSIVDRVNAFNQLPLHPRHPYAGELVFSAFSGSHQDAIKKGLAAYRPGTVWNVPYLPVDPADIGRDYREVVRINSQSGKGGAAYVIERELGLRLPRWLQQEFSRIVQDRTETEDREISADELTALFNAVYFEPPARYRLLQFALERQDRDTLRARLQTPAGETVVSGRGNGALAAFVDALQRHFGRPIEIVHYDEHALAEGTDARAVCYIRLNDNGVMKTGVARHRDIVAASLTAVLRGLSSETSNIWQADAYQKHAAFVPEQADAVLQLLAAKPGENILDLGCGDGALTVKIKEQGCRVIGVDASANMVAAAQRRGLDARVADGQRLQFPERFDAVFSNAALHWMTQAEQTIRGVYRALKSGGRFVGEFGGEGNVMAIVQALEEAFAEHPDWGVFENPWFFPGPAQYGKMLERAGFELHFIDLIPRLTLLPSGIEKWLEVFAAGIASGLEPSQKTQLFETVAARLKPTHYSEAGWMADYVRIRFSAIKRP